MHEPWRSKRRSDVTNVTILPILECVRVDFWTKSTVQKSHHRITSPAELSILSITSPYLWLIFYNIDKIVCKNRPSIFQIIDAMLSPSQPPIQPIAVSDDSEKTTGRQPRKCKASRQALEGAESSPPITRRRQTRAPPASPILTP